MGFSLPLLKLGYTDANCFLCKGSILGVGVRWGIQKGTEIHSIDAFVALKGPEGGWNLLPEVSFFFLMGRFL